MTIRTRARGEFSLRVVFERVTRAALVTSAAFDVGMSSDEPEVAIVPRRSRFLEAGLHVALDAPAVHAPSVRILVTARTITIEPQEPLAAFGENSGIRVDVTVSTNEIEMCASEFEADQHVVEGLGVRDPCTRETALMHHREALTMVLAVTRGTVASHFVAVATCDRSVQSGSVGELLFDHLVTREARRRHRSEQTTMTLSTTTPSGELRHASMHGSERSGGRFSEPQRRYCDDGDPGQQGDEDGWFALLHDPSGAVGGRVHDVNHEEQNEKRTDPSMNPAPGVHECAKIFEVRRAECFAVSTSRYGERPKEFDTSRSMLFRFSANVVERTIQVES